MMKAMEECTIEAALTGSYRLAKEKDCPPFKEGSPLIFGFTLPPQPQS